MILPFLQVGLDGEKAGRPLDLVHTGRNDNRALFKVLAWQSLHPM
jgi:hypothetical protein